MSERPRSPLRPLPSGHGSSLAAAATCEGNLLYSRLLPATTGNEPEPVGALLARNAARFADRPVFLEWRDGQLRPTTWAAFRRDVAAFARFLSASGVGAGDRVAVVSPNRGEMLVAEFATMSLGAIYVPIFPGYGAEQIRQLVERAEPVALLVPGPTQLARTGIPPSVATVVTFDDGEDAAPPDDQAGRARARTAFAAALARFAPARDGDPELRAFLRAAAGRAPDVPCLMMYTSGTSGRLRGVVLTHDNLLSQQRALAAVWSITPDDRFLSYLPWHHSFGGIFEKYTALYHGATLGLDDSMGKDMSRLLHNWREVQPTIYFSVPKVYQQLVAHAEAHPEDAARIFHPGLRFVFTAAAPLPAGTAAFFAARGIPVVEGWGLTETAPCCTLTDQTEPRTVPGLVGYPIPGVRVRVAPDGEIQVQGPNVMRGYFQDPEATARALPGDGWFRTGDLGQIVGAGLRLIARKDRLFKLLNGEKVVPTEIENRLAGMNPYIRNVIVVGPGRSALAALIFPDYFRIREEFGDDHAAADRSVKAALRDTILEFNRTHGVKYEQITAAAVLARELSIENQELTPSLKVRVRVVLEGSAEYLAAIYEPEAGCDCRFLRQVMRLETDPRRCLQGLDRTLDRCHECGRLVFGEPAGACHDR